MNAGQTASFQCTVNGQPQRHLLLYLQVSPPTAMVWPRPLPFSSPLSGSQGMGGRQAVAKETRPVNPRRYVASFDVKNTTKGDTGRYRCIVQSDRGVGVSSYADLTVKRESWPLIGCWMLLPV